MQFVLPALLVVFVTLKLCGIIAWSWVWVLAPIYPGLAIIFTMGLLLILAAKSSK